MVSLTTRADELAQSNRMALSAKMVRADVVHNFGSIGRIVTCSGAVLGTSLQSKMIPHILHGRFPLSMIAAPSSVLDSGFAGEISTPAGTYFFVFLLLNGVTVPNLALVIGPNHGR